MLPSMANEQEWCAYDWHMLGNGLGEETVGFLGYSALTRTIVYL